MNETYLSRRVALRVCATSATCAWVSACGSSSGGGADPAAFGDVSAGNVSNLPEGSLRQVPGQPVFIARDAGGIYAETTTCTHEGCALAASGTGTAAVLSCPCHGSQFDRNGAVTRGPASTALVHFAVEVDMSGNITIHGGTRVSAATRVAAA